MHASAVDPTAALATALLVQGECSAQSVPLDACMGIWSEDELRDFFSSPQSTMHHPDAPMHRPDAPTGDQWRRDPILRESHWLCRACNVAISRDATCSACHSCDLSSSELSTADAALLATRLRHCGAALRSLDVSHNPLGAPGVALIAAALAHLPALTALNLAATCASDEGTIAIADALARPTSCSHLRVLSLMGASVKSAGGQALSRMVHNEASPKLEDLGLGWNQIRGEAARELAAAAVASPRLDRFCGLPIGALRNGLLPPVPPLTERDQRRRPPIEAGKELHLSGCGCGAPGAFAVAALLSRLPPSVSAVVMPHQDLGDEGAVAVAEAAARAFPQLSFVMLSRNDVGHEATAQIRRLIPHLDDFHLRVNNRGG